MLLVAAALSACAAAGPPQTFRFASNHDPVAAVQCATNRLRIEGFELALPDSASAPAGAPPADSVADSTAAPPPGAPLPGAPDAPPPGTPPDSVGLPAGAGAPPPPSVTVTTTPTAPPGPAVALRRNESGTEVGAPEWWRVEVSTSRDDVGRTIVQSVAGVSRSADGPFREPTVPLQGIVGRISASCTW
jgi:hypothetical protein